MSYKMIRYSRRKWLRSAISFGAGISVSRILVADQNTTCPATGRADLSDGPPFFRTRGVVLTPEDLTLRDWPERAAKAGLTTIGLHAPLSPAKMVAFVGSDDGQRFLQACRQLKLNVEYEMHAMQELLPRQLYDKDPDMFTMNDKGERIRNYNLCVHSRKALEIVAENAVRLAKILKPTTSRYFFWGDDGVPWCRCRHCKGLSDSDQALIVNENVLEAVKQHDPKAMVAHLAYANTLQPPRQIKPRPGIFLEFAPIDRPYDQPLSSGNPDSHHYLEMLKANLELFGKENSQALEYWLDVSLFSRWKKPAVKLPFKPSVLADDLKTYATLGVRHVTSFAVYIDSDYVQRYGEPPIGEYGSTVLAFRPI